MFSPEELEELRRADEEIEAEFDGLTEEELRASDLRDADALSDPGRSADDRRRERQRARYLKKREEILAQCKAYRAAHREQNLATQARYRESHREELREKELAYYHAHRDEINARRRAKRLASRESSVVSRENAGADAPGGPRKEAKT